MPFESLPARACADWWRSWTKPSGANWVHLGHSSACLSAGAAGQHVLGGQRRSAVFNPQTPEDKRVQEGREAAGKIRHSGEKLCDFCSCRKTEFSLCLILEPLEFIFYHFSRSKDITNLIYQYKCVSSLVTFILASCQLLASETSNLWIYVFFI